MQSFHGIQQLPYGGILWMMKLGWVKKLSGYMKN